MFSAGTGSCIYEQLAAESCGLGGKRTRRHSSALFDESKLSKAVAEWLVQRLPGFLWKKRQASYYLFCSGRGWESKWLMEGNHHRALPGLLPPAWPNKPVNHYSWALLGLLQPYQAPFVVESGKWQGRIWGKKSYVGILEINILNGGWLTLNA